MRRWRRQDGRRNGQDEAGLTSARRRTIRRRSRSGRQQLRGRAAERVETGVGMRAGDVGDDAGDGHVHAAWG